ncbi:MAG: SBBP repeat-containing protein [candidate division WOR-3 bacterium]
MLTLVLALLATQCAAGDTIWHRRFDGPGGKDDRPTAILTDSRGNVIVAGYTFTTETDFNMLVLKYDSLGTLLWARTYNSPLNSEDRIWAACLDPWDNILVTGGSICDTTHNWDYLTIKYRPDGETAWIRRYDSPHHAEDKPTAIACDDSGNVYVTGSSRGVNRWWDYLTVKYNAQGDTIWTRRYDGAVRFEDEAKALAVDRLGNVIVTGRGAGPEHMPEIVTIKYDPAGRQLWTASARGTGRGYNWPCAVLTDSSGAIFVAGTTSGQGTAYDYCLLKYRPDGREVWRRSYDGPAHSQDIVNALGRDSSGNVIVTGQSMGLTTFHDFVTIKYYSDGETAWVRRYNDSVDAEDRAQAAAMDPAGNVYVTGSSVQSRPTESYFTQAYKNDGTQLFSATYTARSGGTARALGVAAARWGVVVTGFALNTRGDTDIVTIAYRIP